MGKKKSVIKEKKPEQKLEKTKEGLGISGFTLGILSIVLAGSLGIFLSILGFIFCIMQQKRNPMKIARIGIILNIIGFIVSLAMLLILTFWGGTLPIV